MTVTMKNMQGKAAPNHRELSVVHSPSVCYLVTILDCELQIVVWKRKGRTVSVSFHFTRQQEKKIGKRMFNFQTSGAHIPPPLLPL